MKIFPPAVFLLLLLQGQAYSQQFSPGYVITPKKDTVQGYLLEQIDKELVHEVKFKTGPESKVQIYTPEEITGFGFGYGRIFHSFRIAEHKSEKVKNNVVFAKEVETGKIDLLVWRREKSRKPDLLLVNQETQDTVHLTRPRKDFVVSEEGKHYSREDQEYLKLLSDVKNEDVDQKQIKYTENKIRKDIRSYNRKSAAEFDVTSYKERKKREYTILAGTVADRLHSERPRYRAALLQSRTSIEKTNTFSSISGVFYNYRERKDVELSKYRSTEGQINFRRQVLTLVPVGIMFQTKPGRVRPYVYAGLGVAIAKLDDHLYSNQEITGNETTYSFGPNLAGGAGLKFKIGSNYVVSEIAPTIEGMHFNLGYSF